MALAKTLNFIIIENVFVKTENVFVIILFLIDDIKIKFILN